MFQQLIILFLLPYQLTKVTYCQFNEHQCTRVQFAYFLNTHSLVMHNIGIKKMQISDNSLMTAFHV